MKQQPKPGEIWQEVDPRLERYIRIISVYDDVTLETVIKTDAGWRRAPRTGQRHARMDRFNGKRSGYRHFAG